jgi:maltose/moltooligosaccharide transporter
LADPILPGETRLVDAPSKGVEPASVDGNAVPLLPSGGEPQPKRWHVGTLTYTASGLVVLFCWLLWGDFAYALKDRSVQPVVQLMIEKYHASDLLQAIFLIALPAFFGVIIGPIVSYYSDRTRTRWGRRIPYLLIATPVAALAMFALAVSPAIGHAVNSFLGPHGPGNDPSILLFTGLFWALFDVATVVANTLFNALINDVVPRAIIGRFFGLFRILSLFAGALLFYKFGVAKSHFFAIFVGLGLVYGVGFTMMCLKVKEGEYPPSPDQAQSSRPGFVNAARLYLKECFEQPYYLLLIIGFNLANVAFIPVNNFNIPFSDMVHMSADHYGKFISLTYLISICLAYPLGSMADRFHPLRLGIFTMVAYAAVTWWGGLYARTAGTFAIALLAHGVLSGVFFTVTGSLTQRLFPPSRFAQFYSAYWLTYSLSLVILGPIVGKYLDLSGHNYRHAYLISSVLALSSVLCLAEVYRRFKAFGGASAYVAPE